MGEPLLEVRDLRVNFYTYRGVVHALNGVDLTVDRHEIVGLVGETGSGKSVTARSILRLVRRPGRIEGGSIRFEGRDLLALGEEEMARLRGREIAMILQEPKAALNPVYTVGWQIAEALMIHRGLTRRQAMAEAVAMLRAVRIADPERVAGRYPHELSGGMAQRAMIAMMMAARPKLLIADEPTSALDVTIQAQILALLTELVDTFGSSILMITHDLGVVAETCHKVAVMYAGRVVEYGPVERVLREPAHPYTQGLLRALPRRGRQGPLYSIEGSVPDLVQLPAGCAFHPRCPHAQERCRAAVPAMRAVGPDHLAACVLHGESS